MIVDRPQAAFVCIGDEILSGRTQDANLAWLGNWLNQHGVELAEARVVADVPEAIVAAINQLRDRYAYVFTSGGIGATHDDITAESVAKAFEQPLIIEDSALAMLERNYADKGGVTEARKRMARMPQGATLIGGENVGAPGIQIENVYVLAGVPSIFRSMLESLSPQFDGKQIWHSHALCVFCGETTIASQLQSAQQQHVDVKIGSYPQYNEEQGHYTQLVFRGPVVAAIESAVSQVRAFLHELGVSVQEESSDTQDNNNSYTCVTGRSALKKHNNIFQDDGTQKFQDDGT